MWIVVGWHFGPVRSDDAGPDATNTMFFWAMTGAIASATPEFGTSATMLTWSTSAHWLTVWTPISALFWGSALITSTLKFGWSFMKSADASLAAATDPGPVSSAYRLAMSVSTPIFTLICWAFAPLQMSAAASAASPTILRIDVFLLVMIQPIRHPDSREVSPRLHRVRSCRTGR